MGNPGSKANSAMKLAAHTPAPKTVAATNNHGRGRSLAASFARTKRFTDIKQVAMQINAARETSLRSYCSVRLSYTRCIAHLASARTVVPAPPAPDSGKCLDNGLDGPPASRHFSPVLPANVAHGGCVSVFRNVQVLRCWPIEPPAALFRALNPD